MEDIRNKIIIVDDNMTNLTMGLSILKTFYNVTAVPSAVKLFDILEKITPDLVLLDIEMPEMNGYEAISKMKADSRFADIPVIFLTAKNDDTSELEGFYLGAVDYIAKPFSAPLLLKRIENQLLILRQKRDLLAHQAKLKDYADNLAEKVNEKTREVYLLQNAIVSALSDMVEFRDKLTGRHITRTQLYLKALTEELLRKGIYQEEISGWDLELFLSSAPLHDVGKIVISDTILNKPAKLSEEEFEVMKTHVTAGVDAIEKIMHTTNECAFLQYALLIAGTHHEKWDGTGYPTGLKGRNIPLAGRLMAVADVYDALISVRPYKKAFTHDEACGVIEGGQGTHFDPVLIDIFQTTKGEFANVVREYSPN